MLLLILTKFESPSPCTSPPVYMKATFKLLSYILQAKSQKTVAETYRKGKA